MQKPEKRTRVSVGMAVQKTGLSQDELGRIVARELVSEPLSESDLAELRRIRRLRELGVNLAGIEVILHMRQRILALRLGDAQGVQTNPEHKKTVNQNT
jgi:hypothetical protein